ncbi:PDZ domain-containing protein, partial [Planctomycetota bacterium]
VSGGSDETTPDGSGGRGGMGGNTISSNIGVTVVDAPGGGALIESVDPSGRAYRFGLEQGDIVISINGETVRTAEVFMELMTNVERGAAVSIQVLRDGLLTTVGREANEGGRGRSRGGRGGEGTDRSNDMAV